ncbi:MAG TPA: hypothetical protein VIF09_14900, partial [Polyangiaceae bacterium]
VPNEDAISDGGDKGAHGFASLQEGRRTLTNVEFDATFRDGDLQVPTRDPEVLQGQVGVLRAPHDVHAFAELEAGAVVVSSDDVQDVG